MRNAVIDKRYKILKKCGAGATGSVYKIRDLKDKKILALKLLSKQKTTSDAVRRFKREFRLLTQLCHPNLCSVYDFGTLKDGRSYFTMEYVEGPNILEFTKKLSYEKIYPVRKNISNGVYPLIVQLCRALEYIHAKGLIHYDIKPGNVLVQISDDKHDGARVKLTDFGLAGEQRIKGGAIIKGTFPYIAPEVIKFLAVDHRADLYSLGVLLYEILTGKPFQENRESFVTLLQQRIYWGSALPSKIVDKPKGLQRILLRLLAFEPAVRFSRANEVIKEINKFSQSTFALETEKTIEGYLLSSRFVGRDKEMALLQSLYERACQGEGKVVLVTGDAGIGKSRLLKEFKIFTQLRRSHSFTGYAHRDKIGPLEPFYDIFSELINYVPDSSAQSMPKDIKTSLAVLFKMFPDLSDGHLRKNLPRLVPLGPQQEKLRNFEALSELIGYCTKDLGELVILLEDLHWADDLTIQFLEYLSRNVVDRNIFICSTSREEELKEHTALKKMIHNLKNEDRLHRIELMPLKFKNLYSFLDSTITPGSNSSELVHYLMEKTGGNPFFVEEIMRTLLRKGKVSIGEKIETDHFQKISIPETIEDVVLKRLKDLDRISRKVVKFAALLLKGFNYDVMKRLTNLDDTELSKALWELKRRQILVEEGTSYRFYHATLRETLHKRLGNQEKRKLNYHVGKTLENIYKKNKQRIVEDLAYYFINARDRKKGVSYGLCAAQKSSERYANDQAIQFYKGVLSFLGDKNTKRRFDILQKLAQIENLVGDYNNAIKHYNRAFNLKIGTVDKKIEVYLAIGKVYEIKGNFHKALHICRRGLKLLKKIKSRKLKVLLKTDINVRICRAYVQTGDYKRANKFNFNTLQLPKKDLKERETINLLAGIYNTMGNIEHQKGEYYSKADYDKAISYYHKAYKYYKKNEAISKMAAIINNLGICYFLKSEFKRGFDYFQKAIRMSEKTGDQYGVSVQLFNLGNIFAKRGYFSNALSCYQKGFAISKKIGNPFMTGASLLGIGDCFLQLCNYNEAKEYSKKSLKIFDAIGNKDKKVSLIKAIADIHKAEGNYTSGLRFYKKALKISKDIGLRHGVVQLLIDISSIFIEIGEFPKAQSYIEDALKIATTIKSKNVAIVCSTALCRINMMLTHFTLANDYCKKSIKIAKELGIRQQLPRLFLLASEIYYYEKKYLKGIKFTSRTVKLAKEMGTKDLYVEALLTKVKYEIELGVVSMIEITKTMDEALKVAEEIGNPEVLWKAYFEYGNIFQSNNEYKKALDYYQKCIEIFMDVSGAIKNESYKKYYLNRSDRQAVFAAIDIIERRV